MTFTVNEPLPSYHVLEKLVDSGLVEKCYIKGRPTL